MDPGTPRRVVLRELLPEDLPAVHALIQRTIDACYTGVYPAEAVAFFKAFHSAENVLRDSENGHSLVLEVEGVVVGTGSLVQSTIKRVFVPPEFEHHGYGRLIMDRLEYLARNAGVTAVELHASLVSKQFYDSLGYVGDLLEHVPVADGRFLDYYPMQKTLA